MSSVIDCKVIILSKFSFLINFLDNCFKSINSAIDSFYTMKIIFIVIIKSTNRGTVGLCSFYCVFFISKSNVTSIALIFVYERQIWGVSNSTDKTEIDKLNITVFIRCILLCCVIIINLDKFSLEVLCCKSVLSDLSLLPCEFPFGLSFFEWILNWTKFSSRKLSLVVL